MLRLGAGLVLAALWTGGVLAFSGTQGWLTRAVLIAAALPLIALLLDVGRWASGTTRATPASWRREAFALATPLTLLWALDHPALTSWWIRDDP